MHDETYVDPDDAGILETYRAREVEGWKRYMTFPDLAEMIRTSGVTNLAQVYTQLKYTQEDNARISRELLKAMAGQGFETDPGPTPS